MSDDVKNAFQQLLSNTLVYLKEHPSPSLQIPTTCSFPQRVLTKQSKQNESLPHTPPPQQPRPTAPQQSPATRTKESTPPPLPVRSPEKESAPTHSFGSPLQPEPSPAEDSLHRMMQRIAPHLLAKQGTPDDSCAKKISSAWQNDSSFLLLSFDISHPFSHQLCHAISNKLHKQATVIDAVLAEQEKKWQEIFASPSCWVLFPSYSSEEYPLLFAEQQRYHQKQLIALHHPSRYQEEPSLKKELWSLLQKITGNS